MAEYIKRQDAIDALTGWETEPADMDIEWALNSIPAEDVTPVVHDRWDFTTGMNINNERNCPVCKKRIESNFWNFCPNCGAKMDGEDR